MVREAKAAAPVIRRAVPADLDAVERLEDRVFLSDNLSRRSLAYYIGTPTAAFLVIERDGGIVADAIVAFRRTSSLARLYSLAVDPSAAGQGLGRRLLACCEDEALRRGATSLRLEVRTDNGAAIALYRAAGYTAFGRYLDYYEDGAEALRFTKALSVGPMPAGS